MDLTSAFHAELAKHDAKQKELEVKYGKSFNKSIMNFSVNKAEQAVIDEWYQGLLPEIAELQKQQGVQDPLGHDEPYYGAIGGGLTYSFLPTGLGDVLLVKETTTGKELNVSDALDWHFFG